MTERVIRDPQYRANEAYQRRVAVVDELDAVYQGRVIPPYYPRLPLMAGDPASPGGPKVALSEFADDARAALAASSSAKALVGVGSPVGVVTPSDIGVFYFDTSAVVLYVSTGLTTVDWSVPAAVSTAAATSYVDGPPAPVLGAINVQAAIDSLKAIIGCVGFFDQTTLPTAAQIPTLKWAFWFDTLNSKQYLVRNRAGTMYAVELNV